VLGTLKTAPTHACPIVVQVRQLCLLARALLCAPTQATPVKDGGFLNLIGTIRSAEKSSFCFAAKCTHPICKGANVHV
jgi:hypothetical protein